MAVDVQLEAPVFLIAVPQLGDPNFVRTVVFILEHGDHGSMGLVISRETDLNVGDFCKTQDLAFQGDTGESVYYGGPVNTERAFLLHSPASVGPETEEVLDGVCISYSVESLQMLSESPPKQFRVFLGYAGWGPGQLPDEIQEGAWLIHDASSDLVFAPSDRDPWQEALRQMGIDPAQLMHSPEMH